MSGSLTGVSTTFTAEELLSALDGYDDLTLDLLLDTSADAEYAPADNVSDSAAPFHSIMSGDSVGSTSPPSSELSESPSRSTKALTQIPRSQRLKAEREFLREQVVTLERELAKAKANRLNNISDVWRDVAKRQRTRRTSAEKENERLRARLMRQMQVAKSLEVVLRYRDEHHLPFVDVSSKTEASEWKRDLGQVFKRFVVEIQRAYQSLDSVLPEIYAPPQEEALINRSVVKSHAVDGVEQLYVETRQTYVLPFTYNQVAKVAWKAYTTQFERQGRQLELYLRTDDLFACKFGYQDGGDDASDRKIAVATTIARNFIEEDRYAVVWRCFVAEQNATFDEAVAVCTGWIAIRPYASILDHTVLHVCIRTSPENHVDLFALQAQNLIRLPTKAPELGAFLSQKLCTLAEDIIMVTDTIQDLILDEALSNEF
ncbi:hypothetical protein Poli38472_003913 [Pythium oligandrum]|uniref:M96 mating-specific protein family n=1 Tax=Pythium oligandrum TaxID=41045 RepID=A0A8K1FQ09_PYTOL|nr:hypothetical protein Poli38472_003913 [Pythium oligandrum]|eukprot:TMW66148.1 hypothetical protein Poli38472_003913 [Pythium oligandrum]